MFNKNDKIIIQKIDRSVILKATRKLAEERSFEFAKENVWKLSNDHGFEFTLDLNISYSRVIPMFHPQLIFFEYDLANELYEFRTAASVQEKSGFKNTRKNLRSQVFSLPYQKALTPGLLETEDALISAIAKVIVAFEKDYRSFFRYISNRGELYDFLKEQYFPRGLVMLYEIALLRDRLDADQFDKRFGSRNLSPGEKKGHLIIFVTNISAINDLRINCHASPAK